MAAHFTRLRNMSGTTPARGPIRFAATSGVSTGSSDLDSATMRCARSRKSFEYFVGAGMTPPFRRVRPFTRAGVGSTLSTGGSASILRMSLRTSDTVIRRYPVTVLLGGQYGAFVLVPAIVHQTPPLKLIIGICIVATTVAFLIELSAERRRPMHTAEPTCRPVGLAATWVVLGVGVLADFGSYLGGSGSYAVQVGTTQMTTVTTFLTPFRYWELFGCVLVMWGCRQRMVSRRAALIVLAIVCLERLYVGVSTAILSNGITFIACLVVLALIMGLVRLRWLILALVFIPVVWPALYQQRNEKRQLIAGDAFYAGSTASQRLRLDLEMSTLQFLVPKPDVIVTPSPLDLLRYGLLPSAIDNNRAEVSTNSQFAIALGGRASNARSATMLGNAYVFGGWYLVLAIPAGLAIAMGIAIRRETPWGYMFVGLVWLYGIGFSATWPSMISLLLQASESLFAAAILVRLLSRSAPPPRMRLVGPSRPGGRRRPASDGFADGGPRGRGLRTAGKTRPGAD